MSIINLQNLHKTYSSDAIEVHAVRGVNLRFQEGEFTAIAGASGSGKTTLLNMIGGIDTPSAGEISIGKHNISTMPEKERTAFRRDNIGFVFQSYNLLPVLTAAENVGFIMELQKCPTRGFITSVWGFVCVI
jgi:putative ABC transport system ATP-binding protein